uniref:NADH dehydrogenase subunit 6 n=1 Tax=Argulus americanus TaxID=260819 RepID=Q6SL31_9CRUS|nr:NADH dehydrogenase subunit 6 [Argulus americanus]AAS00842.1 NADH dehydrogenase subunit 6 [Argulus americanus]
MSMILMTFLISFFISISNPLLLSLTIIMTTISITFFLMKLIPSWLIMILFILYLSGMMVIFLYMSALSANMSFNFNPKIFLMMLMCFMMIYYFHYYNHLIFFSESYYVTSEMFNKNNSLLILMLTCYLFIGLVVMSFITLKKEGALRSL